MRSLRDLNELGERLKLLDHLLIQLLRRRMQIAEEVEEFKRSMGSELVRLDVEERRIAQTGAWAQEVGLNPLFAQSLMYQVINESCKVQLLQMQSGEKPAQTQSNEDEWYAQLKQNLLQVTEYWAPKFDALYETSHNATHAYSDYEVSVMRRVLPSLPRNDLAIDLGCGTGRMAEYLSRNFGRVIGYDLSPAMVDVARGKLAASVANGTEFVVADIEERIPLGDGTVSFAVMNLGTAGDVRNIDVVIAEIHRVLQPGGKAFLSFYNKEALIYKAAFIPWPLGLAAEINLRSNCLEVQVGSGKYLPIYASPITVTDVQRILSDRFTIDHLATYPTITSLLPGDLLGDKELMAAVLESDEALSKGNLGAYIVVVAEKLAE